MENQEEVIMTEKEKALQVEKEEVSLEEGAEWARDRRIFIPRADIYENDDNIVVAVDLPGAAENQIDVTLEKDLLTIKTLVDMKDADGYALSLAEYEVGDYQRSFKLNGEINRDKIEASYRDGVLRLVLPKAEEMKAKKIAIKKG